MLVVLGTEARVSNRLGKAPTHWAVAPVVVHYLAQAVLELEIFLPYPLGCWVTAMQFRAQLKIYHSTCSLLGKALHLLAQGRDVYCHFPVKTLQL